MAGQQGHSAQNFVQGQRNSNDTGGADKDFFRFAAQALGSFGHGAHRSGVPGGAGGAIAFPALTTIARIRPFEARKFALEIKTGAATTRFWVNTPAAEAGTSLERMAKSSAPVFFRPQAVAAKRKPREERLQRGRAALAAGS